MRSITFSVRCSRSSLVLFAGVAIAVVAACGSDDAPLAATSTTAGAALTTTSSIGETTSSEVIAMSTAATSVTTVAPITATTSPTPTTATSVPDCGGRAGLTEYLVRFARASSPLDDLKFVISDVAISGVRADWGRGTATPPADSGLDGFVAVAHCEPKDGTIQWVVKDLGTSGVGCTPEFPADLAHDC